MSKSRRQQFTSYVQNFRTRLASNCLNFLPPWLSAFPLLALLATRWSISAPPVRAIYGLVLRVASAFLQKYDIFWKEAVWPMFLRVFAAGESAQVVVEPGLPLVNLATHMV